MRGEFKVLDFNNAPKQGREKTPEMTADEISQALQFKIREYVRYVFPAARIQRGEARIGSLSGEPGESLVISLDGDAAGQWIDFNTDERGNAIQLWQKAEGLDFPETLNQIRKWLGVDSASDFKPSPRQEKRNSQPKSAPIQLGAPEVEYPYLDAAGDIIAVVRRYKLPDGGKTFRVWDAVAGKAQQPTPKPLYNIPCIKDADEVIFVEGEKCADRLAELGFPATTLMSGANSPVDKTDFSPIMGKKIALWRDNDAAGEKWERNLREHLTSLDCAVRVLMPPEELSRGEDCADCTDDVIRNTIKTGNIKRLNWTPATKMDYVIKGNWIVKNWIPGSGLGCLYGDPGSGKTFAAADLALHIATEVKWQGERTKGGKVAYMAMESGTRFQNRVKAWCDHHNKDLPENFLYTPETVDLRRNENGAEIIISDLKDQGIKVLIIDTLSRALSGGNENSPEDMMSFVNNCDRIWKALDCFVLIIHHVGKDAAKGMRGHSSLLGAIDTELQLKDKNISLLKQRDGQDGLIKGFDLVVKSIGKDEDGDDVTTCVAVPAEINIGDNMGPKLSDMQREAFNILCNLVLTSGKEITSPVDKNRTVTAVHFDVWKNECRNHGVTDYEDANKARTMFWKHSQALKKKGKIMFYEKFVWIISE